MLLRLAMQLMLAKLDLAKVVIAKHLRTSFLGLPGFRGQRENARHGGAGRRPSVVMRRGRTLGHRVVIRPSGIGDAATDRGSGGRFGQLVLHGPEGGLRS